MTTASRIVAVLATVALSVLVGDVTPTRAADSGTSLRIAYRPAPNAPQRVATLRCDPTGGTLTQPADACRKLTALGRSAFMPTPPGKACTMIYGGPQQAVVSGTLAGRRVWARFTRRDGCEITRWSRIAFLLRGR